MKQALLTKLLLSVLILVLSGPVFAQKNTNTVKPFTGSKGFRKLSVGLNVGALTPQNAIGGNNDFSKGLVSLGFGANVRYQFTHYFALKVDFLAGSLKGDQSKKLGDGTYPTWREVASFKTKLHYSFGVSGDLTFGNINWLSKTNKVVPYISGGGGLANYDVKIVPVKTGIEIDYPAGTPIGNHGIHELVAQATAGFKISLSRVLNLDLGYRMNWVDGDNFDGFKYNNPTKDKFSYGFVGIEYSFGKKSKPQLLFNNPAHAMSDMLETRIKETEKLITDTKTAVDKDTDGDGVPDRLDKEPNTPPNCPVDVRGVSRDTDGDGVPDCIDKQLITPTECQPVDANGVGKCPPPDCCSKNAIKETENNNCNLGELPSITFKANSAVLSPDARALLETVAAKLKQSTNCVISLTIYPDLSKKAQQLSIKRLSEIQNYFIQKLDISADRITTNSALGGGDPNTVDIKAANK